MGNTLSLSAPIVVRLTTQPTLSTRLTLIQSPSNPVVINVTPQPSQVVRLTTSTTLSVKLVVGEKGSKGDVGPAPVVTLVGDQISINGVLGPHLLVNTPDNLEVTAGYALGGHRVVQVFDNVALYADNLTAYDGQLALTMSAVDSGETFKAYTTGVVTEPSWNFIKGPVFLGNNGLLTQTKPTTGTVIAVGRAVSQTSIHLQFQQLYRRT